MTDSALRIRPERADPPEVGPLLLAPDADLAMVGHGTSAPAGRFEAASAPCAKACAELGVRA